ncbi:hypothetical protein M231_04523 [Tremella mesenterica]|uniref:Uncharacterized protein n=1 Tax=Tremella mesenterica TaxID=5217 RepID=A0A4Q1BKH5_TREME|nr:hypothetical protein M231_04523 [Tremella mesenterica]
MARSSRPLNPVSRRSSPPPRSVHGSGEVVGGTTMLTSSGVGLYEAGTPKGRKRRTWTWSNNGTVENDLSPRYSRKELTKKAQLTDGVNPFTTGDIHSSDPHGEEREEFTPTQPSSTSVAYHSIEDLPTTSRVVPTSHLLRVSTDSPPPSMSPALHPLLSDGSSTAGSSPKRSFTLWLHRFTRPVDRTKVRIVNSGKGQQGTENCVEVEYAQEVPAVIRED